MLRLAILYLPTPIPLAEKATGRCDFAERYVQLARGWAVNFTNVWGRLGLFELGEAIIQYIYSLYNL